MRNRVLTLTRNVIPYVKELRIFTDSVVGCILMQQLDYWFERHPSGFYKFLEPSQHPKYVSGQSWLEEIGVSVAEFRTAFDRIGTRWKSKTEFENAADKFQGKFYASYQDKRANLTFYFRNHQVVDAALDALLANLNKNSGLSGGEGQGGQGVKMAYVDDFKAKKETAFTGSVEAQFTGDAETQSPVNSGNTATEINNLDLQEIAKQHLDNTEITITEITQKQLQPGEPEKVCGSSDSIIYPKGITPAERNSLQLLLKDLNQEHVQSVCDEIAGIRRAGKVKVSILALASGLVKKCNAGEFVPAAGLTILAERNRTMHEIKQIQQPKITSKRSPVISLRERLSQAGITLRMPQGS